MNKNGEKTKLLAVIAVFAMVACVLCVMAPSADAADNVNSFVTEDGYTIEVPGYDNITFKEGEKDGDAITASGYAGIATGTEKIADSNMTYAAQFAGAPEGSAYAYITGFSDGTIAVKQTNSALTGYVGSGEKTSNLVMKDGKFADGTDFFAFLIPTSGDKTVTLEITYGTGAEAVTEEVKIAFDVTMGKVINSVADITAEESLTISEATTWILNKDIVLDKAVSISNELTIAASANGGSLTINGTDPAGIVINSAGAGAAITMVGTTLTVNSAENATQNMIEALGSNKLTIAGTDGAAINLNMSGSASINEVAAGAMTVALADSTMNIAGGIQGVLLTADNSTVNATSQNASLSAYFDLEKSIVNGVNVNAYAAKMVDSSIKATGFFGIYTGTQNSAFSDFTNVSEVSVDAASSIDAAVIYNSLTDADTKQPFGAVKSDATATITGPGEISGAFTNNRTGDKATSTSEFTLDGGIVITGNSSVATDVEVAATDALVGVDASIAMNGTITATSLQVLSGATVSGTGKITGTYQASSEASISLATDSVAPEELKTSISGDETEAAKQFIEAVNNQIDDITIPSGVTVTVTEDVYIADWMTVTVEGTLTFGTAPATTGAGEYFTNDGTYVVKGTLNIDRDGENNGLIEIRGGIINITGAAKVDELKDCSPVFENNGAIIVYGEATDYSANKNVVINVTKSGLLSNNGSIAAETEALSRAVAVSGTGWVENGNNGTIGILVNAAHVEGLSYEVNLSQDISGPVTYPSYQTVIVPEGTTLAIKNSATVVINGKMIVNGTLVIEGGEYTSGKLIIAGGSANAQAASLEINGAITVQDGGALVIGDDGKGNATVAGSLTAQDGSNVDVLNGKMDVTGTLDLQTNSKLKVVAYTNETTPYGVLSVQSAGTVNVNGYIDDVTGAVITNYGAITIANGACDVSAKQFGSLTVNMAASGATVTVESFLMDDSTALEITDEGLVLYTDRNDNKTTVVEAAANTVTVDGLNAGVNTKADYAVISGLVVTENTTSKLNENGTARTFTNSMVVSGTFGVSLTYPAGTTFDNNNKDTNAVTLTLDGGDAKVTVPAGKTTGGVDVTEALTTGNNVKLVNTGDLDVTGTVNVAVSVDNSGVIDVTGAGIITISSKMTNSNIVNAAYYVIKNGTGANEVTYHNYATLETAVPAVADAANTNTSKVITIMGAVKVTENLDVPAGISIVFETNRADSNSLTIGSTKDRDVTVTMAVGSKMTSGNGQVIVEGTLVFTDKTNDATKNTVSDVTVEDESKNGSRTYTNIYTALANATDGQTVEVTRTTGYVTLGQSVTIPAGVVLYVPERTASLLLEDGVTLTVDGTLETEMDVLAQTKFGTTAKNATVGDNPKSSAVVVNGTVLVADNLSATIYSNGVATDNTGATPVYSSMLAGAPIYGAYYIVDGYYVISTLEIALADVADIVGDIVVNGPVTVGDVTFAATEDCTAVVVGTTAVTDMSEPAKTVSTILTAGSITVVGGTFGSITGTPAVYSNGTFTGDIVVGDARITAANVEKLVVTDDEDDGMVILGNPEKVGKTGSLTITAGSVTATNGFDAVIDVTVASGATLVSEGAQFDNLFVNGNVTVAAGKAMTADYLYVNGTGVVSIAAATDNSTAGNVTVGGLYMGIAPGDIMAGKDLVTATPGAATVTGPIFYTIAYVLNEAVIDESNTEGKQSTVFHVDGAVWFTAYASAQEIPIVVTKAPIENAILAGWSETENGDAIDNGATTPVNIFTFDIGAYDDLYAVVEYDIYTITIYANEAVDDIFIDGQIMQKGMFSTPAGYMNGYQLVVAAGNHSISYTLANGYSGNGVVGVVSGETTVSGTTFTTAGTDAEDMNIVLQLTGFEKTGYVPESPDTGSSDDSGMGITDYLLIVLVVLIIVMAIIVAMRLMRS